MSKIVIITGSTRPGRVNIDVTNRVLEHASRPGDADYRQYAGIVSYGSAQGTRAAEHLRGILSELQIAHVQKTDLFGLSTDFEYLKIQPTNHGISWVDAVLHQLVPWTAAMEAVRATPHAGG